MTKPPQVLKKVNQKQLTWLGSSSMWVLLFFSLCVVKRIDKQKQNEREKKPSGQFPDQYCSVAPARFVGSYLVLSSTVGLPFTDIMNQQSQIGWTHKHCKQTFSLTQLHYIYNNRNDPVLPHPSLRLLLVIQPEYKHSHTLPSTEKSDQVNYTFTL